MLSLLLALALPTPQGPGPSTAPVVINEFSYDDATGTDDKEFVELYNRTNAPIDLSGWVLQCIEGTGTTAAVNFTVTLPASTMISAGGYVVIGTALVPNLTPGITPPAANWLENTASADGLVLFDAAMNPIDSVLWCYALWTTPIPSYVEGTGLWGRVFAGDTAANPNFTSAQRRVDGYDSNNNGNDFLYMGWTPGTANGGANVLTLNHVQKCDAAAASNLISDFSSSFAPPIIADPSAVTRAIVASVPIVMSIPPSPQGGNVAVMHDPTGGGNSQYLRLPVGSDFLVECFVYVSGGNAALGATEGESYAIGVGTTDSYASPVDVSGTYYAATSACAGLGNREPGATGIAWMAYQTTTQTVFYLVDMNDGGPGFSVLGGPITATLGSNDGWQRLRLRVSGSSVVGNFGGAFGCDDGQRFSATASGRPSGQVYFQYRECVLVNNNLLPLIIDRLEVFGIVPSSSTTGGIASPTNSGTPVLVTSGGSAVLGNSTFGYAVSGLVPSGFAALLLGFGSLGSGTPVVGAPPTVQIYVNHLAAPLVFSNGSGAASYPFQLPCINALAGLPIVAQAIDYDASLAFSVPIGSSVGLRVVVGN